MEANEIYELRGDHDIVLPLALEESFTAFVSASGMPFTPTVTIEGDHAVVHFLYVSQPLKAIVEEFLAVFEPDGYHATELAVPNERIKHTERVAEESGWLPFVRQRGAERTRICFIRTSAAESIEELEERIELVI
jgi:hypothetical protein